MVICIITSHYITIVFSMARLSDRVVDAMTYYGLSMTSVSLADDMYLGFLLTTLVEIPGVAAFYLTIDR